MKSQQDISSSSFGDEVDGESEDRPYSRVDGYSDQDGEFLDISGNSDCAMGGTPGDTNFNNSGGFGNKSLFEVGFLDKV